eukprot:9469375-Heterocapsa_arctica.AAC.1
MSGCSRTRRARASAQLRAFSSSPLSAGGAAPPPPRGLSAGGAPRVAARTWLQNEASSWSRPALSISA